jgi:hypothetical protein
MNPPISHENRLAGDRGARHTGDTPGSVGEPGDGRRWAAIGGSRLGPARLAEDGSSGSRKRCSVHLL